MSFEFRRKIKATKVLALTDFFKCVLFDWCTNLIYFGSGKESPSPLRVFTDFIHYNILFTINVCFLNKISSTLK